MSQPFRITGKHVLFAMIGFFAVIITVNVIFMTLAIRTFPGEQEEKSYLQGLNFNDKLAAQEAQSALGWAIEITAAELDGEQAIVELFFENRDEEPIYDLAIEGQLSRPADDDFDQAVQFVSVGEGRYQTSVASAAAGVWILQAKAVSANGDVFDFETKLYFE